MPKGQPLTPKHFFTKDEVKLVYKLWETVNTEDICEQLGLNKNQVNYLVNQMRKAGFAMARKRHVGELRAMLNEVKKELKA